MTKYLTTIKEARANVGKKIRFKYFDKVIEGILMQPNDIKKIGVSEVELIEEDNQEPQQQVSDLVDSTKYAFDWANCKDDNVNHPFHYAGKIECIDYLQDKLTAEEFKGFLKGNVLKYLSRAGKKDNELEDFKKAQWYMNKLIEKMEK